MCNNPLFTPPVNIDRIYLEKKPDRIIQIIARTFNRKLRRLVSMIRKAADVITFELFECRECMLGSCSSHEGH
jgi:hypothetical protein